MTIKATQHHINDLYPLDHRSKRRRGKDKARARKAERKRVVWLAGHHRREFYRALIARSEARVRGMLALSPLAHVSVGQSTLSADGIYHLKFVGRLAGAIHKVDVKGTVTV